MKQFTLNNENHFSGAVAKTIETGEEIVLLKEDKPIAVIISIEDYQRLHPQEDEGNAFWEKYEDLRSKYNFDEIGLTDDFFDGIRPKDIGRAVDL